MHLDDLPPFLRVEEAQKLTQLGRSQIYSQIRRWRDSGGTEGIPCVQWGRCLRIPTAALLRLAGLEHAPICDQPLVDRSGRDADLVEHRRETGFELFSAAM